MNLRGKGIVDGAGTNQNLLAGGYWIHFEGMENGRIIANLRDYDPPPRTWTTTSGSTDLDSDDLDTDVNLRGRGNCR